VTYQIGDFSDLSDLSDLLDLSDEKWCYRRKTCQCWLDKRLLRLIRLVTYLTYQTYQTKHGATAEKHANAKSKYY
jgi:hypothetical protein